MAQGMSARRNALAAVKRFSISTSWRVGILTLLGLGIFSIPTAQAANCADMVVPDVNTTPSTSPMAAGGTIVINASHCDSFGGIGGSGPGANPNNYSTTHGQVSVNPLNNRVTYINNGDGALVDVFSFKDDNGALVNVTVNIGAVTSPITVTPVNAPKPVIGVAYALSMSSTGGTAPYSYSLGAASLPPGITFSNGTFSGIATGGGAYSATVNVTDAASAATIKVYSFVVDTPTIVLQAAPPMTLGVAYNHQLVGQGGTAPYKAFSRDAGTLPPGITLSTTGLLSGTPITSGSYNVTISAFDSSTGTGPYGDANALTLVVSPTPPITIAPATLPAATVAAAYATTLTATGGTGGSYTFTVDSGTLPAGLTLAAGGALTGTPTAGGSFNLTIKATDGVSAPATQPYTLVVSPPILALAPAVLPAITQGVAFSQTLTASGGTAGYSYAVQSGTLPSGLVLAGNGLLSGTTSVAGSYTFTVRTTDSSTGSGPYSTDRSYSGSVQPGTPGIVQATLPNGTAGVAYSQTLTGTAGAGAPYTFAVVSGALPAGLTLGAGGVLAGTPSAVGTFTVEVQVTDPDGQTSTRSYTASIGAPTLVLVPAGGGLIGTYGGAYSQAFSASGGVAPYTYVLAGTVPTGLSFAPATGVLSGTPSQPGTFNFSVTATDSTTGTAAPYSTQHSYTLAVAAPAIVIVPATLPAGRAGTAYTQTLSSSGGVAPYTYQVIAGALPAGLVVSPAGVVSGTPTAVGSFGLTISATDAGGQTGQQAYLLVIAAPALSLSPAAGTLSAPYASAYSQTFSATGGVASYAYALVGDLPAGLSFNASTGVLSGTPAQGGAFAITVSATDASTGAGAPFSTQHAYTLQVAPATLNVGPVTLPNAGVAANYAQTLVASGGIGPYGYAVTAGALPVGLTLSPGGALSGVPLASGTFNITVTATDAGAMTGARAYSLIVGPPTIDVSPPSLAAPAQFRPYSTPLSASGGVAPYTFSVSGTLPAGLSLSSAGVLSGTPTAAGPSTFTVTATDSSGGAGPHAGSRTYSVTTSAGPSIDQTSIAPATVGAAYSVALSASGGSAPYAFSVASGSLPAGITLSTAGQFVGTPTSAGSYGLTIEVSDGNAVTNQQALSLVVGAPTLALTPASGALQASYAVAYSTSFVASGGTAPYSYGLTGALPAGISLNPATGLLSGTATQSGSFPIAVRVTDASAGAGAPFSLIHSYTLEVAAPTLVVTPGSLPNGVVGVAYTQALTASGAVAPYSFSVQGGSLPAGLQLDPASGLVSGTPHSAGSSPLTVRATDANGQWVDKVYTLTVDPAQIVIDPAVLAAPQVGQAYRHAFGATGGNGSYAWSIASGNLPAGLSLASDGVLSGAPSSIGTSTFVIAAADGQNYVGNRSITLTVSQAQAVAAAQTVTVLAGQTVTFDATTGASGGPFDAAAIAVAPSTGTASVSGLQISYAAPLAASGAVGFSYTLSNSSGVSAPAQVTVNINPQPIAAALTASGLAGTTLRVELTSGARGGPFTAANVVSVMPASAGTATVKASDIGYQLEFAAAGSYSGVAQLVYTLSNAFATSAPATLALTITARADPTKDAEVMGILDAQADATRRMASGQISNFQRRLESLHRGGGSDGFSNGISLSSASPGRAGQRGNRSELDRSLADALRMNLIEPAADPGDAGARTASGSGGTLPGGFSVWTGGALSFGNGNNRNGRSATDFTTSGLSMGADTRLSDGFALGAGVGYGHDSADVGNNGSHSSVDSYSVATYASWRPSRNTYLDGLVGYQWLSLDARRFVTGNGNTVQGSRDGRQLFASLALGYEHRSDTLLLSPYARLDVADATLDGYTERGLVGDTLAYEQQKLRTSTGNLGLRSEYLVRTDKGSWLPGARIEYQRDFQGSSAATMRYSDLLSGPAYSATLRDPSRSRTLLGIGAPFQSTSGWLLRVEYQFLFDSQAGDVQSILIGAEKKFMP
ncbi:putative Ig domain-containing protein [Bacillus subtilis subsp. subtilis]|nr:putative Ig domain-containing protein [Bacillus subtilis subsp. subtilis]